MEKKTTVHSFSFAKVYAGLNEMFQAL